MTWVVPLALGGFAILLMAVFTMLSARKRHAGVIAPAATVGPRILVHDINDDRCTGCDACVAVCPTNVLDLVANKSRVLRFEDCIQCEACMFACPTEALVMFPEGAVPPPLKVPEIDENFQTVVPGQYLIGEVAGKPLVKSAANLGRAVVEHMLHTGLRGGAIGQSDTIFDVAIVGSGPGGLSAALTCIQRGLTYVVLEKEQMIASTIARYPKGKLVMAEPYDTTNLSYLPVFDSAKEQLIPIWQELIQRVGLAIRRGESVESVSQAADGAFELRSTVNSYRAQRVVLSIGTRGKPRTLQVPGENLPKIFNLLDDPDEWRGRSVLVVGGGDSACEAALALADAGAKVMISYRGKGFNRAAPKNKETIEAYAAEGRIKAKLGSQVLAFEPDSVTLALADGNQKRYPNDGAFVLIGADPPVAWLEKMGIKFVERPHQYQMGKTDDIVRRYARATECPEDAARAAAAILGGSVGHVPAPELPMPLGSAGLGQVSGPRKWLRSATSIFSTRGGTNGGQIAPPPPSGAMRAAPKVKKFDAPVPLSEFAKRGKTQGPTAASSSRPGTGVHHAHTGHGRRDQLSAGERTRILRMLRDEGGRLADEDSQVYIGAAPGGRDDDFDFDDPGTRDPGRGPSAAVVAPPPPSVRPDVPAKPAVVVGLAQAQERRSKKQSVAPPLPPRREAPASVSPPLRGAPGAPPNRREAAPSVPPMRGAPATAPPPLRGAPGAPQPPARREAPASVPPPMRGAPGAPPPPMRPTSSPPPRPRTESRAPRRPVPPPFSDEPTRQVNDDILAELRSGQLAMPPPPSSPPQRSHQARPHFADADEPTRMANIDPLADDETGPKMPREQPGFPATAPATDPMLPNLLDNHDEATSIASLDSIAAMERARHHGTNDERTRAVNIRSDPSISDIDWDLD